MQVLQSSKRIVLLFALLSFTLTSEAQVSKTSDHIYLQNVNQNISPIDKIDNLFLNSVAPDFETVESLLNSVSEETEFASFLDHYTMGLLRFFKLKGNTDDEIWEEYTWNWRKQNSHIYRGVLRYVSTDSNESGEQYWMLVNRKLRNKEPLLEDEQKFYDDVVNSIDQLPSFRGISFRGEFARADRFEAITLGEQINPAFQSTSIAPEKARGYARIEDREEGRISTVYIVRVKGGAPVSIFHNDFFEEYEVLLKPGQLMKTYFKIKNKEGTKAFIFQEQL